MFESIRYDTIHEIRLARPPVNALDPALVRALREAVEAAPANGARALVLSGSPGMFSAGLDIPVLLHLDRAAFRAFCADYFGLCAALARSPIPTVAAITGHAPAGGAVLAIMCDYRIMARGAFGIGLNETQVGLVIPEVIQAALRRLIGPYRAERLMVAGTMLDAERAAAIGFIDEHAEIGEVVPRALAWLDDLLKLPQHAMRETRRLARADLVAIFTDLATEPGERFLDDWFGPETRTVLEALVARLKAKK